MHTEQFDWNDGKLTRITLSTNSGQYSNGKVYEYGSDGKPRSLIWDKEFIGSKDVVWKVSYDGKGNLAEYTRVQKSEDTELTRGRFENVVGDNGHETLSFVLERPLALEGKVLWKWIFDSDGALVEINSPVQGKKFILNAKILDTI